ncbi:MFS transporter [Saccharibacillus sp. CPCC 101409]|uniref:MFS transporter n=1 Tax=Saccharibacillus sp. CPCC 101409 TaxID=3058041 RepID=UPI002670E484|nr:MFS transporter [Saccharibacillus sp. CPCC 101409]MDO3409797.1 MFS transporter [Saccharibacillus sp. CPCC 101409]
MTNSTPKLAANSWRRTFAVIFTGQLFSILTSSMVQFAVLWHLAETTGSAAVLLIAGLAALLPQGLLGPFVGVWIDRWNRKATMIAADGAIALFSLLLGIYFYLGDPALPVVYSILAIRSAASAFHAPAFQAAIPLIAPEDQLTRVAGWQQMVLSASSVAGPALGIAVYSASSLGTVLLLDVGGALFANLMLLLVHIPRQRRSAGEVETPAFFREFARGWQAFVAVKPIVLLSLVAIAFSIVFMPLAMLFPLMTLEHFGLGGYAASLVEAAFGIGMIAGGAALAIFAGKLGDAAFFSLSLLLIGISCLLSGTLPQSAFAGFVALSLLMGAAVPLYNGPYMAMIQKAYRPEQLGRVISLVTSLTVLSSPIGLAIAGPVVEAYGVQTWFLGAGIAISVLGLLVAVGVRRFRVLETGAEPPSE